MKKLLVAITVVGLVGGTGWADDPKPAADQKKPAARQKPAPSLKVGDPAPALKATTWLQGDEVKEFEPGKIYVVEFWATWCGPCIVIMPHVADLQAQYRNKGVTFIGYSAKDPSNTAERVAAFVKKRGPNLRYTFAYGDDRMTYDAWMRAAGQSGIPCCFVVDRAGHIAYIGHPMYLDMVLPRVVAGDEKAQVISEDMDKINAEVRRVFTALAGRDPEANLKTLQDFEAKYPPLADIPYFLRPKLMLLEKAGKLDEVKQFAEAVVARATKQQDPLALATVSSVLRLGPGKENKELMTLAVKAAEAMVQASGDKDGSALITLANTYAAAGDEAKAKEYARKAVAAASGESAALKRSIEQQAKKLGVEKDED